MKNRTVLWLALLITSLFGGKAFSQSGAYYYIILREKPVGSSHLVEVSNHLADTNIINCHYDPLTEVWTREKIYNFLSYDGYHVKVKRPNGTIAPWWNERVSLSVEAIPEWSSDDGCIDVYKFTFHFENDDPNYDPNSTGPGAIFLIQYVAVHRFGVPPDDAGRYFDRVTCRPGMDINEAWTVADGRPDDNTVEAYIQQYGGYVPDEGGNDDDCWNDTRFAYVVDPPLRVGDSQEAGNCYITYRFEYRVENLPCGGGYSYFQEVDMPAPIFSVNTDRMDDIELTGCGSLDAPPFCETAEDFRAFGIDFINLQHENTLTVTEHHDDPEELRENYVAITRHYTVMDSCTNATAQLNQLVMIYPWFSIRKSRLKEEYFEEEDEKPEPCGNLKDLMDKGVAWDGSCESLDDYTVEYVDAVKKTDGYGRPVFQRTYRVQHKTYDWVFDFAYQTIRYRPKDPTPFIVEKGDATCEDGWRGRAQITDATTDQGCPSCEENNLKWYKMEWHNNTNPDESITVQFMEGASYEFYEIWEDLLLAPGDYTLKVIPLCTDYPNANKPIWKYDFKIKEKKSDEKIDVRSISTLWSLPIQLSQVASNSVLGDEHLIVYIQDVCGYDQDSDDEWDDTRTNNDRRMKYKWLGNTASHGYWGDQDKGKGYLVGMTEAEYDQQFNTMSRRWSQDFRDRMGHKLFDGRTWEYFPKVGRNDLRVKVEYRLVTDDKKREEKADFVVYYSQFCYSSDPNEIYGPEGYDTVHFINATDPITYTINFENDPEFATGSAARVKITCPLDDKGVANTFRLGNFGFGDYTFEVPSMASQYSQRLDLVDSLGVWLDVTAGIMVPDNYAYWIFQSIDPTTGLPPVGNLGFLPVNDTLNPGNGEGYVTFTINPRNNIVTGDEINEQANIVFDQNDTVPTNIYTNRFDAVAPSSVLVGDTTGVGETGILNFSFTASDDTDGSGVDYINLYVNIDNTDYELVGKVDPDTVYQYHMGLGSQFEFIGCAIDHVENKEEFKTAPEFTFIRGGAPTDIRLSASTFDEDAPLFTVIGNFTTTDDQTSNVFVYSLVDGEGADHNALFDIIGNALVTNNDFRCYGLYDYSIRVRSIDLSNQYMEKVFAVHAIQNMAPEITTLREFVCPNQPYYFGGEYLASGGIYYDTLQTALGCDSIVCLVLDNAAEPLLTELTDSICFGSSYADNGYDLTADTLALLTAGWSMDDVIVLSLDRYTENYYGCYDTTRLALTVLPAYHFEDEVVVCPTDLPFAYQGYSFYHDTTAVFHYGTVIGCDSTYTLRMTVNPDFGTQSNDLVEGWSWYSTFLDQNNGNGLASLENAMDGHGHTIKSMTAFARYSSSSNTWYGSLHELNNTSMFMIKMTDAHTTSVMGCPADIEPIMLAPGCTWIGYPLNDTIGVSQLTQAIEGNPSNNDVIKSKTAFAMYHEGNGVWHGLLKDLTPGNGYIYMSKSSAAKTLDYNNRSRIDDVHLLEMATTHWMADERKFADNMTMQGVITLDGQTIESDTLEVGAFVNGEQRGAGRAVYIEEMDAYRIFLTIHGEEGDLISFRLFDHSRNRERRIRCKEQLTFRPDIHYGALDKPFSFVFLTDYDRYIQAEICEGEYYTENNFHVSRQGTYFQELTTAMGNDSIVRLDLTVNPVYHVEETVVATGFPFEYEGVVFDKPGTHILPFQTAAACDSVWVVTLKPYEGERELLISPVPVGRHEKVDLYFPFTEEEQQGIIVEVFTVGGNLLQTKRPIRFPIEIDPFATAGTYMVKITMGTGEVLTGKIVVK